MTDKLFNKLWKDALEQPNKELFIAEYGYPDWFHPIPEESETEESETEKIDYISFNLEEVIKILEEIHNAAHITVREIVKTSGMSGAAFSLKFCIPLRTLEHWIGGTRQCPNYIRLWFCQELGIIARYSDESN